MSPDAYCQQKAAAGGSSVYYSILFLQAPSRRAVTALYAFCREIDDVVDECTDPAIARTKLAWWRDEIGRLFSGLPQHPVARALLPAIGPYSMTSSKFNEIIDGAEMDLVQTRYLDYPALQLYCRRTGGAVGELAAGIFGQTEPASPAYADRLGRALQLTEIIRDVGHDARQGRVYVPIDDLQRFDVKAAEILNAQSSDRFKSLMKFQADRARNELRAALSLLPEPDRRAQRPGLVMAAISLTLLNEIERDGFEVLRQRVALTPVRMLLLSWRTWVRGRVRA